MDTLTDKELFALYEIANTIGTPRSYDWYILIISFVSVIVSAVLVWRVGRGQIKAQRDAIKMQLFDKRYRVYLIVMRAKDFIVRNPFVYAQIRLLKKNKATDDIYSIRNEFIELLHEFNNLVRLSELVFNDEVVIKAKSLLNQFDKAQIMFQNIDSICESIEVHDLLELQKYYYALKKDIVTDKNARYTPVYDWFDAIIEFDKQAIVLLESMSKQINVKQLDK